MEEQVKNPRPTGSSSLPTVTLVVLVGLIAALLYVGYDYFVDNTDGSEELTNVALDTTSQQPLAQNDPDMLMAPEEVDTSSQPVPVDLSQAEPPAGTPEVTAEAEEVAEDNRETTKGNPSPSEKAAVAALPRPEKKDEKPKADKPKEEKTEKPRAEEKKAEVAVVKPKIKPGGVTNSHTVGAGETFYGVANRYNMKLNTLKELNPGVTEQDIKAGVTKLNVKVMAVHTVGPGDVLRVVAQKYGVSKEALMRANRKQKDMATRGEKLIIPYPEKQ